MILFDATERLGGNAKGAGRNRERNIIKPQESLCKGCTACCELPLIPELNKPVGKRCVHVHEGGCDMYHGPRQKVCKTFKCYALGQGMSDWHPLRSGIMICLMREYVRKTKRWVQIAILWEYWQGALVSAVAQDMHNHFVCKKPLPHVVVFRVTDERFCSGVRDELFFPTNVYTPLEENLVREKFFNVLQSGVITEAVE